MTHVTLRSEFENLIDPYASVGQIGTGFDFTEGPIWHPVDQYLLFSDMPADVRRRWDPRRGRSVRTSARRFSRPRPCVSIGWDHSYIGIRATDNKRRVWEG